MSKTLTDCLVSLRDRCRPTICFLIIFLSNHYLGFAQLTVTEATTNAEGAALIENVFLGSCVSVSNVTYSSSYSRAVGEFSNGSTTNIGLDGGIIMTSGRANIAIGPNNSKCAERQNGGPGDADLTALAGVNTRDRTVLEFDFIPQNDTLTFEYVFASEEYHEWVNAGYNDAFGFFISGPGIAGPYSGGAENIALIPGTSTAVTIDNVNNGQQGPTNCGTTPVAASGPCTNCAYFVDNTGGTTIQYDAFTTVLTATAVVTPCLTYHIKLAVGDAGDQRYDSGVFLKGGSFSAGGGVTVEIETTTIPPGIYEGCADAWFIFRRVDGASNTNAVTANFTVSGTATPGVDYTPLPSSITIPAGQDSILVPISVALDFITEGNESIIVTLENPPCACEAPGSATVDILDNDIPLAVTTTGTTTICLGQSADLTADPTGSQTPYTSGWDNGAPTGDDVTVSPTNTTTYTYTVTDVCGGQTVTSSETITVIRPDFTVDDDEQCFDGNSFNFTNTGATGGSVTHLWDFGDSNSSTQENPTHSYAADGSYTVTHYIIFTASNCTADASALITVFPEPEITATVDQNVICDGGTDGNISTNVVGGTPSYSYLWSPGGQTTSSISGQGVGTYTVTVTDANGCTDSDSQTITQVDPVDPTAVCQNITIQLDGSGNVIISATDVDNGSSDNCGIASMVVSPNAFTCAELGANTVTLTVTDVNGNTDDCTATVTVEDNVDPSAVCQNVTVYLDGSGNASVTAADVDGGSTDNCSVTVSATPLAFICANVGANSVTLTATDQSSNTDNCTATVTVLDTVTPTAICQDITVQLDGSGNVTITANDVDNGSNDNCSVSLSATPLTFNCANTGANTVTLTATDPSGNSDDCTSTVTVEDDQDPTVTCQDITVQLDGSGNVTITSGDVNAGSSDNCSGLAFNVTPGSFTCANLGVNTVTLTVTDASGNVATCTADVTVQDTEDPNALCTDITVYLDASGNATITAADVDNGSTDNCSVTVSATPLAFTCANVGANSVTLTATDQSSNTDNCTATVTVADTTSPAALCQDVTLSLDGSGNLLVLPTDIDNGSNDACGISGMFANPAAFDCSDLGPNAVTLTVTDNNGNVSTCVSTVTVVDDEDPTAVCQDITVYLDGSGNATITAADVDNGSSDNCSVSLSATPTSFTCSNTGANTVTLTATDPSSNTDNCTSTATVLDTVSPTAVCQNITVYLDGAGNATITAADVDNGSTDNCSVSISASPLSFTCANTGANTVTLTATDPSSNTDNCTSTVTVLDTVSPTAICQDLTIQLDASGNASITANDVDNGSSDNCSVSLSAAPLSFDCSNAGANTVTLTATDPSGNTDDCTATVTVDDDIDPTASCVDITVQLDASGNASIVSADIDGGSTDNCSGFTVSPSPNSFTCADLGVNTVTLTVTDASGNVSTCTADVTIEDNVDPTAVCQNITVYLDGAGNASITAADVDGGSTDNCSVTVSATPLAFTCANVGANSVTLTATDQSSNTDNCTATVTVADTTSPVALCQDITIQLDATGNVTISATDVDNGSTDNCAVASLVVSPNAFTCAEVGANTVTLTVTDVNGNTSTCTATVTVEDDIDPTAVCQNITVQLDANGDLTIASADIDGGSSDNCGITSLTIDGGNTTQDFDCSDVGANTVTLTVTDVNGNVSTCDATVTVEDNVDPSAVCQDITIQLDANGDASIATTDIDNGSSDNCGIASITLDGGAASLDFDCSDVGVQTVTLTVTDVNGNVSTCTADVTVEDNVDPTAVCQDITVQLDASGSVTVSTVDIDNGSSDACGIASITLDGGAASLDFDCSDVGVQTVTLTVTDVNGNVSTCTADVTVQDTIDPTAVCQDITIQLDASGNASVSTVDIDNGSSDNCGIASITLDGGASSLDFDCSDVGVQTVTLIVTDVNGNVSTCTADVTVEDNVDPSAVCQDVTVQLDASGSVTVSTVDIDNGSSDACGIATITLDGGAANLDFNCSDVGVQTVTLTVTDVNGNVSTCDATVTVADTVSPAAVCQDITVQLDGNGDLTITSADVDGGSTDACGIASLEIDGGNTSQDFDCSNVGINTVTLTLTDVNGNVSTCDATVTIQDTIDPTAVCQDITIQLDASGNASVSTVDIDNGSNDNCGIASITLDGGAASLDFDCSDVGVQTVTLTVTDVNGNVSTCTADVTVEDNINPTAVCQDITVQLDANGDLTIVSADIDGGSADNCGIASLTIDGGNTSQDFDCSNVGANTVTLTVTDVNGNVSTCDATVTVADTVSPTAVCQDITVQLDGNGDLTITSADVDGGSTDACGIASLEIDGGNTTQDFDCSNVGTNTVTLTVTDVNGNVSTCDATVTIQDTIDPTAVCQDITIQLDASGNASVSTVDIDNGSNDNCGIASITLDGGASSLDFDCSDVGVQTVILTVTDVNGNVSTCTADVTVEDNIDPTAVCQDITIQLDASGNASISTVDIDNGSNDNCGIASITLDGGASSLDFDCSDVGVQTVTLTVTDVNGNVSTCTADVTVEDNIDPTALCQNITIQLDASGNASISTVDIDNGSNDNCGIASITLDGGAASLDFDCSDVGVQTVTLTVTDVNGNVSTCTADVTVQDTVSPTAICQDITVQLDASGNVVVTTIDIDNGSNDNCGIASITLDGGASSLNFDCSDEGVNTVTLTVTDVNDNVSTCTADVTVENNIIPTVACQDITVYLDATGNVSIVAADVDGGSNAACGIASLTIDQDSFTCANVGTNTVTLTGTDNSGNVSTCTSTVTVLDTISPDAVCQDITVQLDASGNLTITSADIDGGSADNCAVATLTIDGGNTTQDFDCSNVGANTVTLTVTDVNGNVSTCDATVTVQDTINPSAVCQDITVQLDANGDLTIVSADIDGGSADNCGIASLTIDGGNTSQDFACANVGTNTVTLTVTDVNGNVSTCDATVTVADTVSPNAVCQDITVQLDSNGDLTITSADIDGGSTDACGIASLEIDGGNTTQDFDCSDVGTTTVTLTVTDVNGNVSTCDATVTIEDNVDPTAVCQDITVQLDANGDLTIASADIDGGSTDNCGVASLTIDGGNTTQDFDCSDVGANTVTLTVTDVNGNVSTCDATVTIQDTVSPNAVCQDITIQLDASGNASISTVDIDNGSNDNCGIASITLDGAVASLDFDCSNVGVNTVTLTVTDVNGNVSTCTADVTVQDTIDATAVCQDITVQLDVTGNATITGADVNGGSTDNCGVTSLDVSPGAFDCSNVGVNTVTLTVTDDNGNTSTCTADVTIEDNVDPTAVCQDITVYVDAAGDVTIVAADVDGGSTDNCAIDNIAINDDAFDCNDLGGNLVTLTVTDVNGNVSTCTSTVTVLDTVAPTSVCIDIVAELSPAGTVSVAPGDVDNGSFDNCAIASITLDPNTFTCAEVGFNTVTLTVTDASGNVSTCDAQVDVQDNVLPSAVCQNITVQLDASGNAIITPVMVDNGSTDACGSVTPILVSPSSFDCSNVGVNIVTLTVEDQNGNISTCAATVTIQDTVAPIAICQDITVQLDATGNASIVPADVDGGSSDNCAIDNMTVSPNSFTCAEEGPNTVTLTVTDVNGNVSTCDATVTVENNIIPTVSCQDITVYLDGAGAVSITAADVDGGSNAACGIASLTVDPSAFTCAEVGANTVTLTGTDNSGNVSTCTATVTVVDTISPAAVCQDIAIQLDASGNASIVAADVDGGSTDNCAIATLSATPTTFGCAEVGANTVTLTVTDVNGNSSTCTSAVTVEDDIDPTIVCQNITVELDATGNVSITGIDIDNGTTDNCSTVGSTLTLDVTPSDFDCNNVGSNTVTLTATDENGNSSTCMATVTVQDNEAPIALCQDITIYLDGAGSVSITPADIDNGSTDNCAIDNMVVTPNSFSCSGVGANPVTLTVTDVNGNVGSCISTVTVLDTISPSAVCQDITVQLDASGNASIVATQVNNGSSDECGIDNIAIDVSTFDCSNVGANTVELTVTDVNGNVSTCTSTVTLQDNVNPNAVCQNITVQLDASGNASITAAQIDNGSTDNCAVASLDVTPSTFDCSNVGANTVTLTVTDVNGNTDNCTATVTVEDNINPTAVCQDITVQLDASGNLTIASADIDGGSSDNCAIASLTIDGGNTTQDFDCSEVGTNTVTLTVTDVNGNVSTCDATVTVQDTVSPTAVCQDITVQLDATGNLIITSADVDGGSNDNCSIASLEIDNGNTTQAFDCANIGTNTVTLTVTDVNGNVSTCDATVTVQDTVTPVILCQDITIQLDANGEATITGVDLDGGTSDNCSQPVDITFTSDVTDFDCSNVGVNTVILTATDANGNVSTCSADVTVEDNVDPTAVCQDITVYLDGSGNVSIVAADVDGGSFDNCAIDNLAVSQDAFVCAEVGANTVTLTVTDVNGNTSTCAATVTVQDTVSPIALCQDITIQLDATGNATISATDVDNGSSDNCAIASLVVDPNAFTCAEEGANTVTLTVTDVNGNVSSCTSTVTVENNVAPNVFCQDITVYLDATGNVSILADDVNGGSNASCGLASLTVSPDAFDCSSVGPNTVTLTAVDNSGNTSTCDATVTVLDTISPAAVCQDITVQLDAAGQLTITSADVDGGSSDNCAIASLEIDNGNTTQDLDCSQVGTNTVTLTVTDVNGNVSTCDAIVTVEDTVSPNAICQDITVQLDANGQLTITSADIDGGSNDNCGIASLEIDGGNTSQDFDCTSVGANTVTLTVTDVNGNVSTCDATVTVEDTISPSAVCQDITVQLDANGELTITSADIDGGSNDNCGIASLEIDGGNTTQDFDCSQVGTNTVTLTVTDVNGNVSTCDATVTVQDTVSPNAVCQDITVQLDANGELTITSADIDGGSNDNCGIASLEIDGGNTSQDFDCTSVGTNTVTLTVTDVNGNVSTCDATVTVQDTVSPNAVCQDITVQLDVNGQLTITSADIDGGSNDNCGIASLEIDNGNTTQDFDCTTVGTNTVTLTVTDVNGNVSTCDATVTVEDTISPSAVCQNITVQLDANGELNITSADIDGGSADNCGIASLEIDGGNTTQDFDCTTVGTNTVTLTVTDVNGNVSTCDATVTVEDTISPTAVCQDITVQLDANGELTITSADIDGGSNDNCGIASLEINSGNTTQDFDCTTVGTNTVTLTVTDVNGNVSTCDATVTVEDTISPTIVCQDITIELDATGTVVLTAVELDGGTTDNCGSVTFSIDAANTQWTCANVGTQTITLTATDANGNVSTCDAQVTIENNVEPTVSCQDITVYLDATGNVSIIADDVNGGSNASCGLSSLIVSPNAFGCSNIGANTVTLTATDSTGNVSTCTATVTVLDTISPTALCNDITIDLTASGDVIIDATTLDAGSTDNCAIASVTVDGGQLNTTLDCSTVGVNTVTVTVTDVNGNSSTCDASVTVEDNTNPTAACASVTVQLDANGETIITPVLVDGGSSDNCGIDSLAVTPTSLNCNNVGTNSIVLTVWDVNGNISTCIATVTAEDTIPPTAVCTDILVQLNGNGTAVIAAGDIDDGSFDNCGIQSLTIDVNSFDCSDIGPNTVELTVTDVNGNVSNCTSTATVVDQVDPLLACQNITVYLDANGEVTISALDVDNGSTDNCGIDTMTVNITDFDCSNIGGNQVTLTVTDLYGNSDVCQASVTVLDTVPPTAVCQDITIQLDATGTASIVSADVDGGSTDACGVDAISVDQTIFDCTQVGPNVVTLTVVDVNGNVSSCEAIVTVEDNVNPNANCQDITIYLDAAGNASILAADINAGSNANCGVDTVFANPTEFDCSNVGNNTVTLTVIDNNGNSSTCTSTVEVLDTISPTALCQNITTQVNVFGEANITAGQVNNGSFDNCGILALVLDDRIFDCSDVGVNVVTLTVTDVNGNVSTCTSEVTVEDTISPVATCTPFVVQLDADGIATITAEDINLNSSDNCAVDTMLLDRYTFNCAEAGVNVVVLTVFDVNGNSSTCTADVIVEENLPPQALCQNLTVYLDAMGDVSISPNDVDAGSVDNCAIDTMYVTPNDFTCSGVGPNPVVLTVEDVNGNVSSCSATVTVVDTISPIAVCQDITIQLDANGNATIVAEEIDNGSNDACGILGFTADVTSFDCSNVGANTVTLTVEDNNGNTSTCIGQVTIEDNVPPMANCLDLTVTLDGNGTVNVSAGELNDGSTDNCAIDSVYSSQVDFTCADLGSNIVTLTVVDVNGNTDNCSSEVTVLDTIAPVIIACPTDTVIVPDSSDCSPQVFWTAPTAQDNCTPTLTSSHVPGDNFPVGTTTVIYTATDESNNTVSCSFDVTIQPSPVGVVVTALEGPCGYNLGCSAVPDGVAMANVTGGCLPYTYLWTDGQTTQTATGLTAGLHAVTVTDANGTTVVGTIILTAPQLMATDSLTSPEYIGGANVSCNGAADGSININVIGGEDCLTYTYAWTGPNGFTSTDEDLTGLEAGTYTVVVTDASGCFYSDNITLTEPDTLDVSTSVSDYNGVNISCGGASDGWIDLTISGGASPYSVSWNNGEMTEDIDSLVAGIYTYTITDANGCTTTGSIALTEPDGLASFITTSDYNGYQISCFGLNDGSIDLTVTDGTAPYSYLWTGGAITEDLNNLSAGNYIVEITDANGCTRLDSVELIQPNDISIESRDTVMISCNGDANGAFTVEAIGGVPAFTYQWSDGQTGETADSLSTGTYIVVATDLNGCQDSVLLLMTEPLLLEANIIAVADVNCFGETSGIVDVNVTGGTAPYTYDWSNDSTTQDLNPVEAGIYQLEVTDANGCTDTLTAVVAQPTLLTMNVDTVVNATCSGAEDGEITVEAQGGTPPYSYSWPDLNLTGPSVTGLTAGVYEVEVIDDHGCAWSMNVTVGQPTSIEAQVDILTQISCNGIDSAEALVTVGGGTAPYTYLWSNNDTDSLAQGLGAGTHSVTITDAGGCDTTIVFELVEPTAIAISIDTVYNVTCNGYTNGQAEIDVAGGTIPYSVSWSNGNNGYVAGNLPAGTVTAYVTDGNGCSDSLAITITEPDPIAWIQHSTNMVTCFGGNDGEATVQVEGGVAPYDYTWPSIGQTGITATTLSAGWYTFNVIDANSCIYIDSVLITQPNEIVVTVSADTAVCPGNGVGISASATGGAGNFSYSWDNGLGLGSTHVVSPSVATTYTVEVFDQSGCPAQPASVTVDIANVPVAAFSTENAAPCILPASIDFTNMSSDATGFQWLLGNGDVSNDENPTATYTSAGTYTVTLIAYSGAGCVDTSTSVIVIDDVPVADFTLQNAQGCGPLLVAFGNGSSPGLNYTWDFGDGTTSNLPNPTHLYEIPGTYDVSLIVEADGGCTDTLELDASVSVYPSPIADFTPSQITIPEPGSEYEFVNNSIGADLYNWNFGNGDQTDEFQPTYEYSTYGGYYVTLTAINEFGCADTAVHYISVDLQTSLFVPNALAVNEEGEAGLFLPKGTGIAEYHLWIFDNWGNQLWETTALENGSPAVGWNGWYKGKPVPQGSYVWKINATFVDGEVWEGMEYSNGTTHNTGTVMVLY
ncbi:MAG: HYR domain-containing protein [Flavobacteriales bacterium]|nr:HYR domain-containing protein [Flavobacteriales bacterium]